MHDPDGSFMADLADMLRRYGLAADRAQRFLMELRQRWQGERVYIAASRPVADPAALINDPDPAPVVAAKHGVTPRTVYRYRARREEWDL